MNACNSHGVHCCYQSCNFLVEAFSKSTTLPMKVTFHRYCSAVAFHDFIFSKIHAALVVSLVYFKFDSESDKICITLHCSELRHKAPRHKFVDDQLRLASVGGHPSRQRCQNYRNRDGSRAELVHAALILSFEPSQRACYSITSLGVKCRFDVTSTGVVGFQSPTL